MAWSLMGKPTGVNCPVPKMLGDCPPTPGAAPTGMFTAPAPLGATVCVTPLGFAASPALGAFGAAALPLVTPLLAVSSGTQYVWPGLLLSVTQGIGAAPL